MRTLRNEVRLLLGLSLAAMLLAGCDDDLNVFGGTPPPGNVTGTPGNTFGLTTSGRLITFNRASPSLATAMNITGLASGDSLLGIDVRPGGTTPGQIYGLANSGKLYTIDPTTGAATLKSTLAADPGDTTSPFTGLTGNEFGVDFNPVVDRLRIVSDTGQNLRVNVDTGAVTTDGTLNGGGATPVTRTGVTDTAYSNDYATTCRTALFYIDTTTDKLLTTTAPNDGIVTEVGSLGVDASALGAFEISTATDGTNTATAVFTAAGTLNVYQINLTTGAATLNGAVTGLASGEQIRGITLATTTGPANAVGQMVATTESNKVISFQPGTPQKLCTTTAITGLAAGENILGIDTRPADGLVYGLASTGKIYTIDPASGAAALKSTLAADPASTFAGLQGTEFGVDFNPVPNRLRVVSDQGQNLRIDVDAGLVTTDTPLNPAGSAVVAAAYTNSIAGAGFTTLYVLDAGNDRLQIQGQPSGNPNNGDLLTVGALGLTGDVGSVAAFDINGQNNMAFAALNVAGAATSDLYTINLTTGAASKLATIGGGERVRGATLAPAPIATMFGATIDNRLVSFKAATPGTLDTDMPITGLQGGDMVLGIDFRQKNGKLYAATNGGRVYTVDPATAVATLASNLAADATDTSNPFSTLMGTNFGVDFNPVADRLRIVSDAGQNLRINVDTGFVTTDGTLNPGTPQVVAAAYKQSFPGTTVTQLLDIDLATNSLLLQNPPNDGTLTPIGLLDPTLTFSTTAGFDIAGGDDGVSYGALQPTGSTQSVLYKLNPKTGAVTAVAPIGPAGTSLIRALAIRVK